MELGLILAQVTRLRARINSLAVQHGLFWSLGVSIAAGAVVYAGAYLLAPLTFLGCAALALAAAGAGLWRSTRGAWRMRANLVHAAEVADERADLRGRLVTIVQAPLSVRRGALWEYLLEDTAVRRAEFAPARIERRRVSPAVLPLAAALVLAALALRIAHVSRAREIAMAAHPSDITVDLNHLQLRPADPGSDSDLEVQADAATMRRLEEKLAREGGGRGAGGSGALGGLAGRARGFAGRLQRRLRGERTRNPRMTLHLADAGAGDDAANPPDSAPPWKQGHRGDQAGQFQHQQSDAGGEPLPRAGAVEHNSAADASASGAGPGGAPPAAATAPGQTSPSDSGDQAGQQARAYQGGNGGPMHGIGADPDSLFGAPATPKLGTEGFEIAIQARPMEHGPRSEGGAYVPPKVRALLNSDQHPDEPVARAQVPAADREIIKRVFDR